MAYFPEYRLDQPAMPQYSPLGNVGGGATPSPGKAPMANPYIAGAGLGLQVLGTASDIYGKYRAREDAKDRYEDAMRQWEEQKRIEEEDRQREMMRQQRQEAYYGGQYSQDLEDRFAGAYGGYRQGGQY